MAEWSGFFDAHKLGDSWDRVYLAEDFAKFFAPLIGNGVFAGKSNELQVFQSVPAGMSVVLSSGQSWIEGYGYTNDSDLIIPIDPADGVLGRIDRIVNQWSALDRQIRTVWKKGTPAVNPVAPPLQWDADYKELNLCTLNITAGLSAITQDKIKDTRADSSVCGWVTGLIDQVDTSTLFAQWDAAYEKAIEDTEEYLDTQKGAFEAFLSRLPSEVIPVPSIDKIGWVPAVNPEGDGYDLYNIQEGMGRAKAGFIYPLASAVVPDGFLLCDGAAYARSEYPELFAAIGTMYGSGDGATTFNVPDLRNRVPAGASENHPAGEMVGEEAHTQTEEEVANHSHEAVLRSSPETTAVGGSGAAIQATTDGNAYAISGALSEIAITPKGGSRPFNVMQPTTYIHGYIIATGKGTGVSVADIILGAQALPLGLEYGGVGATDPKTARENLGITPENIGAMSMELLWENASPTSVFSAQTITLDLSAYTHVLVSALVSKDQSYNSHVSTIAKIGDKHRVEGIAGHINLRCFIASANGVVFEDAQWVETYGGSGIATNNSMIPTRIYGIKGVRE